MSDDFKRIEVNFPARVPAAAFDALDALCRLAGYCSVSSDVDGDTKASWFAADYLQPVALPDGLLHAVDLVTGIACDAWARENPSMVMWPASHGCKPTRYDMGAPVEFDDSCYVIDCYAREDYHGENPLNPDGPRLRELSAQAKKCAGILSRAEKRAAGEAEFASWSPT